MTEPPPITNISDPRWVRAISHPLRLRLLAMLDQDPASSVMLATALEQPLGTVAYHVRTLYNLGLLELVSSRQRRGAIEHSYRTKAHPRFTDEAWAELDVVSKQRILTAILGNAHEFASRAAGAGGFEADEAHSTSTQLKLDPEGWTELADASKRWLEETAQIETNCAERLLSDPESAVESGLVILIFETSPAISEQARLESENDLSYDGGEELT